ncbi:hypothetical protein D9758_015678 [Tetrapyrgos nigripes]|uniref:Heterokaryon incompatibility domain-containing protein n=1 Tax=Tetrapyrgos nigripes TaxID=182062 RepID=A0A8H5C8J4_9AGAR|nr:hypothetical protein D9758_015678 [Tetrapyrgos nigripes]
MEPENQDKRFARLMERFKGVQRSSLGRTYYCKHTLHPASSHPMASTKIRPHRLIDTHSCQLVEFANSKDIPPYAIISHRWMNSEEVSFQEFTDLQEETMAKPDYQKILEACDQARIDNLRYLWIDTCCIDKGSHADISRNIRCMYAYYQNAEVCYAYLVDVDVTSEIWRTRFLHSEWFKRGWTLQELLAPDKVVFFDKEWSHIGTKCGLNDVISHLTSIPSDDVLDDWQKDDKATGWGLLFIGLLGVSMEPDYDETLRRSLERLWAAFIEDNSKYRKTLGDGVSLLDVLDDIRAKSRNMDSERISASTVNFMDTGKPSTSKHIRVLRWLRIGSSR